MNAGIYARISKDSERDGLGVKRQISDCRAEAARRGWTVADVFTDNDVSATRSKPRPEYQRMLTAIRGDLIKAVLVWDVDRLTRAPRELEDVIDLADEHGLQLANVGGDIDLSSPQGRMVARIKGSVARHETDQQSRRLRRKFQEKAEAGDPHGFAPYGYERVPDVGGVPSQVIVEDQADVIREASRRILGSESLRGVVADFNARGIHGPRAIRWNSTILRQILLRPSNAGLRSHRGKVVGKASWPAIYSEDTYHRLVALLTDPERRKNQGSTRKHLLTGLLVCGRCGARLTYNVGKVVTLKTGRTKRQPPSYVCPSCMRLRRKQDAVDELVTAVIVERLKQPDALAAIVSGDPGALSAARDRLAGLEARFQESVDLFAEGVLSAENLRRLRAELDPKIAEARAVIAGSMPSAGLGDIAGERAGERWAAAPLEIKRMLIELLMTITVLRVGPGRTFTPEHVRIEWK